MRLLEDPDERWRSLGHFDPIRAKAAVKFFELLPHVKGEWAKRQERLRLETWQQQIVEDLFGTLVEKGGPRLFRTAYLEVARKNGKTTLGAATANFLLFADGEHGAEVYSAASDKDQASICFDIAAEMMRRTPALASRARILDYRKRVQIPERNSFYRAVERDAASQHGYNASGVIFDELHAQPNQDLWVVLTTSHGSRRQPLDLAITTAGYDRTSICYRIHDKASKVLRGVLEDPTFYPVVYSAADPDEDPEQIDWLDEDRWRRANPALGTFRSLADMRQKAREAEHDPPLQNEFKRLYLNLWTGAESRYIPQPKWDGCAGEVDEEALRGLPCYAGLDLASKEDVAALVLVFPLESGQIKVLPRFWVPEEAIHRRSRDHGVPYHSWCREGCLEATPGEWIDYAFIEQEIRDAAEAFDIQEIAHDRWGSHQLVQRLGPDGERIAEFVAMGQGYRDMSEPTKELLGLVLSGRIEHGGHTVLRWMCDNMMVRQDPAGNVKPDKKASTEKIDGMVALIMAVGAWMRRPAPRKSAYEEHGLLVLRWD